MKKLTRWFGVGLGVVLGVWLSVMALIGSPIQAQDKLLSVRTSQQFDVALEQVQQVLTRHGFQVAHIQKCDSGLEGMGYKTDDYKIVFFGRLEEVRALSKQYPDLVPLFPFKLAVYTDGDDTVLSVLNPEAVAPLMATDPVLQQQLSTWGKDFRAVLTDMETLKVAQLR
ncbi:hypothetical protein [Candidatus Thiothrix anitrata]|jgi:uncharacterized protein (DUF302 family)|uniref:DUF302 domain-containing protein n=1 Tax=Candidatus Thiothrix anitrata TaxID=2823902 RepID=A0ABX7X4N0_9GAMM|nr:hypothetical protein [Candidatus Thiothrix anitrata]QTR50237.1 hypothetical protein J8380_01230 [Candidatus Thiothrix anitrata]